jgi:hypothetical protein
MMLAHMRDGGFIVISDEFDPASYVSLIVQTIKLICGHSVDWCSIQQ